MFDNRCMYYLTIVVVMLFSVSFIKLNKFWELDVRYGEVESDESMGTTIFKGVRFLIGIVLILMPGIMNPVYQSTEGMIVECVKADPVWRVDADDGVWHVTVEDTETGTKKIFYRVKGLKNVREGMKVEIHSFDADMFLGEVFAKVDGRTTQWYKNGIKERPGERVILLSLFLAYALELCWIIMKGKQKLEERKIVTYYYYLAILGLGLYASMVIFVWRQHVSGRPWSDMLCIGFYLYMFGEMVISLSGVPVEKIKQEERLKKERKSLRAEQENRDEKERFETEWREREEGKTVNKENVLKLTKMGYIASKKYCRKKYRKEVRKHMKGIGPVFFANTGVLVIICLILEGETALLTVGADILLFILIYVISRWNAGRKCREWKKSVVLGEMCEYGMFRIRYLDQIEFECAEGKKIIYRMDREKEDIGWDGNLAVAVYVEAQDRLCMESPRMLSQFIERDWGDADQG